MIGLLIISFIKYIDVFQFSRDEIESNEMVPKRGEKVPGRDLPRKPNAYNMTRKLTDEQLNLKSIEQLKSLEKSQNSQGTPTSQVTIVENSNMNKSMSLMRPPLLRKQANEVKRNFYSYFLCNFLKTLCHNYLGRLVVYLLWNIYVALTSSIQKYY